jgi:hypothetical protein
MGPPWEVWYYEDDKGQRPAEEFIDELHPKPKAKVMKFIEKFLVNVTPTELAHGRPQIGHLRDGIYELRVVLSFHKVRLFFKTLEKHGIILITHGMKKYRDTIPPIEIDTAVRLCREMELRIDRGDFR